MIGADHHPPLAGRTAVVTGGGRGAGAAIAARLATAGAAVLVASRTAAEVESVAARLCAAGHRAHATRCDVADPASIETLARTARAALGQIDILVSSAGVAMSAPVQRTSLDDWQRLLAVNATGPFLCTKVFLSGMLERGWGRIVNVASIAGLSADRYLSAYAASKHAVIGLTRAVAAEVAGRGVTVNAICPGYLDTEMTREALSRIVSATGRSRTEALEAILSRNPQHRLIEPDEVAASALFLCGHEARGINGETLVIDGGELRR
jgi:NAD(P)-dependent dehydrogenase (short-subunit alcohol dehydrogenase family)